MTETRKLAAIPAADVVGFGRLAGADEERTLRFEATLSTPKSLSGLRLRGARPR